jgi:hypothetical protein
LEVFPGFPGQFLENQAFRTNPITPSPKRYFVPLYFKYHKGEARAGEFEGKSRFDSEDLSMESLYRKYSALVLRICYRYTENREEASDLTQKVFSQDE